MKTARFAEDVHSMVLQSVSGVFRQTVSRLGNRMQPRTKRLVLLSSLAAAIEGRDHFDRATIDKLNRVLALAHEPNAVQIPALLSKTIWQGRITRELLSGNAVQDEPNADRLARIVETVISSIPSWLRYGDDTQLKKDISQLLEVSAHPA